MRRSRLSVRITRRSFRVVANPSGHSVDDMPVRCAGIAALATVLTIQVVPAADMPAAQASIVKWWKGMAVAQPP